MSPKRGLGALAGLVLLLTLATGQAQAAGPAADGSVQAQMVGQARVDQSKRPPRLLLSADSVDGGDWRLDVSVSPTAGGGRGQPTGLAGQFTLSGPGIDTITGQATGQLDRQGTGSLQLTDATGAAQLDAEFVVGDDGQFDLNLAGQVAPPSPAEASVAASTSDSQPVNQTFWFVTRAAGLSAYVLLFVNMALGLGVTAHFLDGILGRWRAFDLHQFTALLGLALLMLHVFVLLGDQYVGMSVVQLLVPLTSVYRPVFPVALGIVALYVLVVVTLSFYVRDLISVRTWRALHYLSFGAFVLVLAHGIFSGTDSGTLWARALYWSTGLLTVLLVARRFVGVRSRSKSPARRLAEA